MAEARSSKWAPMATAPRDGTLVLARVRASEQGPSEVDAVRWVRSARSGEENWVANDSDPFARVIYADGELSGWTPLPSQTPRLRSKPPAGPTPSPEADESDGSAI
jgi:hypothetical protein